MDSFGNRSVTPPGTGPVLLYDGECGLCGAAVRFVIRWDRQGRFRFASLNSKVGRELLAIGGVDPLVDSLVVITDSRARVRSAAVLEILRLFGGMWHLLRIGGLLPTPWLDALYDWVAARRGRISKRFGMPCMLPSEEVKARFL